MSTYIFTILLALPPVRAGGWDDFSNNLATDLAPFLSLFGEQITKQYLSESITTTDYFIFAMAPMGILTAVVSAIRVCGTASLRAFIGRAQEGAGNAEAELCSSTSRDVCELYNNGGIARVFGRPKILEVVHDPDHDFNDKSDDTAGIYTFQEYVRGKGKCTWQKQKSKRKKQKDPESDLKEDSPHTVFSPNLSLNIGIKKQPNAVFNAIALGGLILQSAVLVFAGVVTYYLRWEKNGSRPESYACPLLVIGTVLVCGGMFYCAFLVGQSTDEDVWLRQKNDTDNSSMYWVQPGNQIVGDQTFDAFSHTDYDDRLEKYTTSRRKNGPREWKFEVWTAIGTTISGFVLQFTGLRGIHSAVAVAQLGIVLVMSTARAALRMERFKSDANSFAKFPDEILGHELDWLALRIGRNIIEKDLKDAIKKEIGKDDSSLWWSSSSLSSKSSARSPPSPQSRYLWRFKGAPNTDRISLKDPTANMPHNAAAILLAYRTRLASLTVSSTAPARSFRSEMVEVRTESQQLAALIEATVDTIFSKAEIKKEWKEAISMFWGIDCAISEHLKDTTISSKDHRLYLEFTRQKDLDTGKYWVLKNSMELEGLLGLWVWSLKSDPAIEVQDPDTGLTNSIAGRIKARRLLPAEQVIKADLGIWLGDDLNSMTKYTLPSTSDLSDMSAIWKKWGKTVEQTKNPLPVEHNVTLVRFFGRKAAQSSQSQVSKTSSLFSAPINGSLVSACAQEIFSSFLESILDIVDDVGPVDLQETEPFRLQNSLVTEVVTLFAEMQLGTRQEALLCVVPLMISHLKTPSPASVLAAAGKSASKQRRSNEWKKAEEMLRWVWRICIQSQSSLADTPDEDGNHQRASNYTLAELATIALGELYRWALVDKRTFGMDGISWLEKQKSSHSVSICEVIDRYVAVANGLERDEVSRTDLFSATENGCLTTTLLALTRPASNMESEQKGNALCLAAKRGWAEVVRALLELNTEPDFQDAASRTPLSYAAANGNVEIARELIYSGSFPDLGCPRNRTPLSYASEAGAHRVVELLLRDIRVSPDHKDSSGLTPLCWAAKNAHDIVVEQLLDTGKVDPDAMKSGRGTPLWWAALEGHDSIVQRLLDTGKVDPDARNGNDQIVKTPLSNAASKGHGTIVKLLLETGKVDPDSKDNGGRTPLYWAAIEGHEKVVKQLLETGKVDPDAMDSGGWTPLTNAAINGHETIVKLLLETENIDPDTIDQRGHTPLSYAARHGHDHIVKLLIKTGKVDPNARDDWNKTPLHWAARFGRSTVVKQLLENSMVDPDAKDLQGQTPLWWARDSGHDTIVTQLLETGKVDPDPKATCGYFEANLAARKWKHPKRPGEYSTFQVLSAARLSEPRYFPRTSS
jgi:ankyrin repeat protein